MGKNISKADKIIFSTPDKIILVLWVLILFVVACS